MPKHALRCLISGRRWFSAAIFLASPALGAALKLPPLHCKVCSGVACFPLHRVLYYGVTYFFPACGAILV